MLSALRLRLKQCGPQHLQVADQWPSEPTRPSQPVGRFLAPPTAQVQDQVSHQMAPGVSLFIVVSSSFPVDLKSQLNNWKESDPFILFFCLPPLLNGLHFRPGNSNFIRFQLNAIGSVQKMGNRGIRVNLFLRKSAAVGR